MLFLCGYLPSLSVRVHNETHIWRQRNGGWGGRKYAYAFVKRCLYMTVHIYTSVLSLEPDFQLFLSLHTKRHDLD